MRRTRVSQSLTTSARALKLPSATSVPCIPSIWVILSPISKATLIRHSRLRFADGGLIEVKLWSVSPSPDKPHGFKYSLVYIERRKRIIGYDNGERRGDHRHYEGEEESYEFMTVDDLIADFMADVDRWRREK